MSMFKEAIGCWIHERIRLEALLRFPSVSRLLQLSWLDVCNRQERISRDERTGGRVCHWNDTSSLTVARIFQQVGKRLLQHCLNEWPIEFDSQPKLQRSTNPDISIILTVQGLARRLQFDACLASLRAQKDVDFEIIVVEQSSTPEFHSRIPTDVGYLHQRTRQSLPFNKSWAFNYGAAAARGRILLLHDADMVLPSGSAAAICRRLTNGLAAIRLPRLIFYMDQSASEQIQATRSLKNVGRIDRVIQNNPTPLAVTRECYYKIGGHDESFFGWGAEDLEFLDRLRTADISEGMFLPILHLWHPEAPNRAGDRNEQQLAKLRATPAVIRIKGLVSSPFGGDEPRTMGFSQ